MSLNESSITLARYSRPPILVTGADGSIGSLLVPRLEQQGHRVYATDIDTLDVTQPAQVWDAVRQFRPRFIFHLAGAKHAPEGEADPAHVAEVNTVGTANVVRHASGARVILASTCKACDPETAYGASKLIAERIVLNANGVVARFYNVRETQGNVFRLWEQIPPPDPIPYTNCRRYFITAAQAVRLCMKAMTLPSGRYAADPGEPRWMVEEAADRYPGRPLVEIPRRRGDRHVEPLTAMHEQAAAFGDLLRITGPHDPAVYAAAA